MRRILEKGWGIVRWTLSEPTAWQVNACVRMAYRAEKSAIDFRCLANQAELSDIVKHKAGCIVNCQQIAIFSSFYTFWMPDQVQHDEYETFCKTVKVK
jgi:hypothetical protein